MFSRINTQYILLTTLILLLSCKSQTYNVSHSNESHKSNTICPEEGNCNFSISPNQSIDFKKDEFGIGYAEFIISESNVLKFEYQRNEIPNTADGHYIERVYLELPRHPKTLFLKDQDLEKANLLFERVCYCKGQTGFYKIDQGTLSLRSMGNNRYHLKLSFKTSEVPQIITEINEIFSLE